MTIISPPTIKILFIEETDKPVKNTIPKNIIRNLKLMLLIASIRYRTKKKAIKPKIP